MLIIQLVCVSINALRLMAHEEPSEIMKLILVFIDAQMELMVMLRINSELA